MERTCKSLGEEKRTATAATTTLCEFVNASREKVKGNGQIDHIYFSQTTSGQMHIGWATY